MISHNDYKHINKFLYLLVATLNLHVHIELRSGSFTESLLAVCFKRVQSLIMICIKRIQLSERVYKPREEKNYYKLLPIKMQNFSTLVLRW